MNLALPNARLGCHPAWLLLLLPPVLGFGSDVLSSTPDRVIALIIRFLLALLPVVVFATAPGFGGGPRGIRIRKELRGILPGALLSIVVPGLLGMDGSGATAPYAVVAFGLGCLWVAAAPFGSEFEQRTLAALLSQPIARRALFWEKFAAMGVTCLAAAVNFHLVFGSGVRDGFNAGDSLEVLPIAMVAVCTAPCFTLASRSTLAGIVFSVVTPGLLMVAVSFIASLVHRAVAPAAPPSRFYELLVIGCALAYLASWATLGYRRFMRLQIDGSSSMRPATSVHPLAGPLDRLAAGIFPVQSRTGWILRSELRLHVVPWLVGGTALGLWLLLVLVVRPLTVDGFAHDPGGVVPAALFAGILGTLGVVGAGAACVAEERALGVWDWQLCLPVAATRRWWLKVAVAAGLGFGLSLVLPTCLLFLGFPPSDLNAAFGGLPATVFGAYGGAWLLVFSVSVFASSFTRNTTGATITAVTLVAALGLAMAGVGLGLNSVLNHYARTLDARWQVSVPSVPAWVPSVQFLDRGAAFLFLAYAGALALVLLHFAGSNARVAAPRRSHVAWQCAAALAIALVLEAAIVFVAFQIAILRWQAHAAGLPA